MKPIRADDSDQVTQIFADGGTGVDTMSIGDGITQDLNLSGGEGADKMSVAGGGVVTYALFGIADGFWMLFVVNVAASAMFMALIPLGENLASRASVEHGFDYGRVRLWGSITFILAAYAGGWVVEETGDAAILWMIVAAMIAAFIAGPRPRRRNFTS